MSSIVGKLFQRVDLLTLSLLMAVSGMSAAVPLFLSQKANADAPIAVSSSNTQGWITDDTRANGHVSFVSDATTFGGGNADGALSLKTDTNPASGKDKAQYMHYLATPIALSSVTGALSFDTKQNSANFAAGTPSYQIPVYLNGPTGTNFATLVYEPYVDQGNEAVVNSVWQHWTIDPSASKLYVTKTLTGQNGNVTASQGANTYTLSQIEQYFPNAQVIGYGLNVGSNNPGYDVEADNFTFNGTTYNFVGPVLDYSNVYVSTTGSDSSDGTTLATSFATIQKAVDSVNTNGIVHVAAGSYAAGANITKSLTILGAQAGVYAPGRTHGAATETLIVGVSNYAPTFAVNASNVTIDGFDFGPSTNGAASGPVGVELGSSNGATIKNSIFEHNQRGVSLSGASNVTINGNFFNENNSASAANANASIWGDGVNSINISNNELDGASNTAINLASGQNIMINANVFKNTGNTAVIWQDQHVTFSNNYGRGFNGSGFFVTGSNDVNVTNNDLSLGAAFSGISISAASGSASSAVTITGNTLSGFLNGINLGGISAISGQVVAHANKLGGNTNAGVNAPSNTSILVDASSNYWGAGTGPSDTVSTDGSTPATNPGTGAAVNGAVNYGPWYINDSLNELSNRAPVVAITNPADGSIVNGIVNVTGTVTDGDPSVSYLTVTNDSTHEIVAVQNVNTGLTNPGVVWDTTQHADGAYTVHLEAKDLIGNEDATASVKNIHVIVDNTAPSVHFVDPTPGNESYVKGAITGKVTATDDVGMGSYYIRVWKNAFESGTANLVKECSSAPGGNLLGMSRNVTCSLPTLPDGKYVFSAQFLDGSNNWGTAFRTFYVDNTVPTATIDGATPKAIYNGSTNINVHAIDDNYLRTDLYIGDGASSFKTYTDVYFGLSWLGDGNYRMDVIDKAGNSTEYKFTIDKTAPVVTINAPANTANNKPTITGTINDPTATVGLDIDGTPFVAQNNGDGTWTYAVTTALSDGSHTLMATGTDKAGNTTTPVATASMLVDTTGPTVTIAAVNTPITTGSVTPTVTATDVSTPLKYLWTANSANPAVISFTNNIAQPTFTPTVAGTYNFTLVTTDALGNQTTKTFGFTYTPPAVTSNGTTPSVVVVTPQTTTAAPQVVDNTVNDSTTTPEVLGAETTAAAQTPAVKGASDQLSATPSASRAGLAWYWWVLIVAAIASFVWWMVARIRNRANEA